MGLAMEVHTFITFLELCKPFSKDPYVHFILDFHFHLPDSRFAKNLAPYTITPPYHTNGYG